jgi:hypothetical protein
MWNTVHVLSLKDADGAVTCNAATFGGDPAPGFSKWCRCADGQPTAPPTPAFSCLCFEDDGDGCTVVGAPAPAPTFAYSQKDCSEQGYAFDVVTRTCQPDVPVKDRGCYPRANCDADYAARFCDSMTCIPQGFEQECAGMAEFSGHGPKPSLSRSDMFDTDGSTGGQSANYADLAQTTREYYGLTMYTRILRVVEREVGEPITTSTSSMAQFGYLGQWIAPLARTKYATDSGSHASGMASIEGGVYNNVALGASRLPKYLAGASLYSYQPVSDVGRGWGFAERAIGCQYLGLVTLSNRVLVPASGYGFEATQDDREDDGGIFLGAGWVVLPIFPGGSTRDRTSAFGDASFGATTWTHVIDTAQFSGPLLAYAPEFWTRRVETWCDQTQAHYEGTGEPYDFNYPGEGCDREILGDVADACCVNPSIYDTFTHKPGDWWPSTGGEFPGLQGVFEDYTDSGEALPDDYAGPTYWKIPQMLYPNHTDLEPWQLNARTYNADSYDHWLEVFAYAGESDDELEALFAGFDTRLNGSYHMASEGASFDLGLRANDEDVVNYMDIEFGSASRGRDEFRESSTGNTTNGFGRFGWSFDEEYEDDASGDPLDPAETNIYVDWQGAEDRVWSRYLKTTYDDTRTPRVGTEGTEESYYCAVPIDESEAPEGLHDLEYTLPLLGRANYADHSYREDATFDYDDADAYNAWNETEQWCWDCTDATECELEVRSVVLESTATLYYRWWRFRDQPAMKQLEHEFPETYTEEVLAAMQKRVELMHEHWNDKDFIKKATKVNHKVELDHRLILDVPDGVPEYGWVPISVAELYEDSTGYGPGIDAGFLSADW